MEIIRTSMEGCYELQPNVIGDTRGCFVKTYQESFFKAHALESNFLEEYYTILSKNVLRGLHFQTPPFDHAKCVFCMSGEVFDVVLDIRKASPTYGRHHVIYLSGNIKNGLYIERGFAHGFLALSDNSTLLYKVTSEYTPSSDSGILWNSAGIDWPKAEYIQSQRDITFPQFNEWQSPFA